MPRVLNSLTLATAASNNKIEARNKTPLILTIPPRITPLTKPQSCGARDLPPATLPPSVYRHGETIQVAEGPADPGALGLPHTYQFGLPYAAELGIPIGLPFGR